MKRGTLIVIALLTGHAVLLAWGAYAHSPTWDEGAHLPSGLTHLTTGNFDLYRVNPPLVRMVAALPLLASQPRFEWNPGPQAPTANLDGVASRLFINSNADRIRWLYATARWACIPFSLIGGLVCWVWARQLYGAMAGLVALTLWCICPNVLGHGQLLTPDVGASALGVAAAYFFWRWLKSSTAKAALAAGLTLGLAELTKSTWIILFALWPALALLWQLSAPENQRPRFGARLGQLALMMCLALYVLNLGYAFEGSFTRLRDYTFVSRSLKGNQADIQDSTSTNRFANSALGSIPVPVPRNYLQGIDRQKSNFEKAHYSYLRGQWRNRGWYHYYLYAMLIKIPLGTWIVGALAVVVTLIPRRCLEGPATAASDGCLASTAPPCHSPTSWRDEVVVLAPAFIVLFLVSSETGFNRHLRYVLPVFPFLFVWISKVARYFRCANVRPAPSDQSAVLPAGVVRRRQVLSMLVAIAMAWSVASSMYVYPHSLSYFNELIGGPTQGYHHLASSNVDWGQDLWYLQSWYNAHPQARPLHLGYRLPFVDPRIAGIEYEPVPPDPTRSAPTTRPTTTVQRIAGEWAAARTPLGAPTQPVTTPWPKPGWFALSATLINAYDGRFEYFQDFEPTGTVGYSMNVYYVSPEQATLVRQRRHHSDPVAAPMDDVK